jgi:hypothetical protein
MKESQQSNRLKELNLKYTALNMVLAFPSLAA